MKSSKPISYKINQRVVKAKRNYFWNACGRSDYVLVYAYPHFCLFDHENVVFGSILVNRFQKYQKLSFVLEIKWVNQKLVEFWWE